MKVLGLIPARGGSKELPGKNVMPLLGRSLIERAAETAKASGVIDRVLLSTDDPSIREHGLEAGVEAPFLRPEELARDDSPMIGVAVHALEWARAQGDEPDALLLLQPTSPLRSPEHIRRAVGMLGENDSVCTVLEVPKGWCPHYLMKISEEGYLDYFLPGGGKFTRRQDVPPAYKREGTIFLTKASVILEDRDFYGRRCVPMLLDASESLNIDTPADWDEAVRRLSEPER
jgi:CMP-N,N'-diacetyllegionaminic acid synthase